MFLEDYQGLGDGNFLLSIIYFGCALGALRQCVCRPKNARAWKAIRRYFMLSLLFGCLVRSAAFATVFILSLTNSAVTTGSSTMRATCVPLPPNATAGDQTDQQKAIHLFAKVLFVLTNLPDMMIMSSFALFFLVWMEVFQTARRHWHSGSRLRRRWMRYYLVLNVLLYALQIVVYALLFTDTSNDCALEQIYEQVINVTVAVFDLALPVLFVLVWIGFTLAYAGFPFRSHRAKFASARLTRVTAAWCFGRSVLGVLSIGSVTSSWDALPANDHSMIILAVLVVCDILPICLSLTGTVGILLDDAVKKRRGNNGGGARAARPEEGDTESGGGSYSQLPSR